MADRRIGLTGTGVLAFAALIVAWLIYQKFKGGLTSIEGAIQSGITNVYDAVLPDANLQVQSTVSLLKQALAAAGNPQVGSDAYNNVMVDNGHPELAVRNQLTTVWPATGS